jgi:hypothetical protein
MAFRAPPAGRFLNRSKFFVAQENSIFQHQMFKNRNFVKRLTGYSGFA